MQEKESVELTQQALQKNYDDLCEKLRSCLVSAFEKLGEVPMDFHGNYACAVLPMTSQSMIGDFLTLLETKMDVNILYAFKKDKGKYYEAVGYSVPIKGQLFIVILTSHQHGVVDRMKVLVYNTYEPMLEQIKETLADLQAKEAERILEQENAQTVYSHFFK